MKIKEDYFTKILEKFIPKLTNAFKMEYELGGKIGLQIAIDTGIDIKNKGQLNLSSKDEETLINNIVMLIRGANKDISQKINLAVNDNIVNRGSNSQLKKTLSNILSRDDETYRNRFRTIARTESTRVLNLSAKNTAVSLGATGKYLNNPLDKKTGEDSKISQTKYGGPDKAIPLDEPFRYTYNGKVREFMLPPDRPNDRSIALYTFQ
jgi:hypothetical protein